MQIGEILRNARRAKAQTGRPIAAQFVEMLRLRATSHRILADEYFDFRLFDPALDWAAKREYMGRWSKTRAYRIQDADDAALASDKLRAYRLFHDLGLAYPRLIAIAHPSENFPGAVPLRNTGELADWLRGGAVYPFFAKPSVSYSGYGACLVAARTDDALRFGTGETMPIDEFAALHSRAGRGASLFQECIRPHPSLAAIIGDRAATARIMVLNDGPEPEIFRGSLRIPVGNNMTDNFREGKSGNLLTHIIVATGRTGEVLAGVGLDRRTVDRHPDTGASFDGLTVPDWEAAQVLLKTASKAMPGLKVHSWDLAFTDTGPMLVETNPRGDFPQQANNRGLAEPRFLRLYEGGRI